jgi:hypothetical protein
MQRITDRDVRMKFAEVKRALALSGETRKVTFYRGNSSYKESNKLIVGQVNVWPDNMAGFTARDAYNAFRIMLSTLNNFPQED